MDYTVKQELKQWMASSRHITFRKYPRNRRRSSSLSIIKMLSVVKLSVPVKFIGQRR